MWFEKLTGFVETNAAQVRSNLKIDGDHMVSLANGRRMKFGELTVPSLENLRQSVLDMPSQTESGITVREIVADVQTLHLAAENTGALFQVASQFNLLEMVSPDVTPDHGIDIYEMDKTQGPACAVACGAGTIFRNYFVPNKGRSGQSSDHQIDCLFDLGIELGNEDESIWKMKNGYALPTKNGLKSIQNRISNADEQSIDRLRQKIRIGIQWNTEVTLDETINLVTQAYCSALPVAYCRFRDSDWEAFAKMVLEAAYEATLCVAILNRQLTGNNSCFLTMLGGGAFGNKESWIVNSMSRALTQFKHYDLDVQIVSYGRSQKSVRQIVSNFELTER